MTKTFEWGTVSAVEPLRVQLDGDTAALPFAPDSLVNPLMLAAGDRVRCEMSGRRLVVLGRASGLAAFSNRNRVINGNFRINQYGYVSGAALALGAFGFDRWKANADGTTLTFISAPQGQSVTINSGHGIAQIVERANLPAGDWVLSWSGTAAARVYNVGSTPPAYAASPVVVSLDGTADVVVEFTATGAAATIGAVQLEAGTTPTLYEITLISDELARCQRYYQRGNLAAQGYGQIGTVDSGAHSWFSFPTTMRATPTLTILTITLAGSPVGYDRFATAITPTGFGYIYRHGDGSGSGNLYYNMTWECRAEL